MIAATTLRFLDPFGTGKLVLFQVTYDKVRPNTLRKWDCVTDRVYRIGMHTNSFPFSSLVSLGYVVVSHRSVF